MSGSGTAAGEETSFMFLRGIAFVLFLIFVGAGEGGKGGSGLVGLFLVEPLRGVLSMSSMK